MTNKTPFTEDQTVDSLKASEVVDWMKHEHPHRLLLPPIQRSVVWRNEQIINYWDSLLRGYPPGMMMIHQSNPGSQARSLIAGNTQDSHDHTFQLFDGQQRITTILLAYNKGQLADRLKLWVDLGSIPDTNSQLLFQLRISSTGQPFGYKADSPNEKTTVSERTTKAAEWRSANQLESYSSARAFEMARGSDLIGGSNIIHLAQAVGLLGDKDVVSKIQQLCGAPEDNIAAFVTALQSALQSKIVFQLIAQSIVKDEASYIRLFDRLGRGGTALSQDELTYSIIKHRYPQVHDRMVEIMDGPGRMVGEVNLVLGALRVTKLHTLDEVNSSWDRIGRPYPDFVSRLNNLPETENAFTELLGTSAKGNLYQMMEAIRKSLAYTSSNTKGLPSFLLARLPHELVDVLLLFSYGKQNIDIVSPRFALRWILFVTNSQKAANYIFQQFADQELERDFTYLSIYEELEKEGLARPLISDADLALLETEIDKPKHILHHWEKRFSTIKRKEDDSYQDSIRILAANRELTKRALLYLQRKVLSEQFPDFDPTTNKDEDLPIDLDHLIPDNKFGFNWKSRTSRLSFEDMDENFRHQRCNIGNTLGNFRWLNASENRSRGKKTIDPETAKQDLIKNVDEWNDLIEKTPWKEKDVATFQRLIDARTLELYRSLVVELTVEDVSL